MFSMAPKNSGMERAPGKVGDRKEKTPYFSSNVHTLWKVHL